MKASLPANLIGAALLAALMGTTLPAAAQNAGPQRTSTTSAAPAAGTSDSGASNPTTAADNAAGAKGAKTYCFMRAAGNTHQVSWDASYALIKRQSSSLFKTSPEHAAVMITEAVVNNPEAYPDCGKYLGDLYSSK